MRDKEGNTPLIVAAKNGTYNELTKSNEWIFCNRFSLFAGYDKVVAVLVRSHARLNVINKMGQSALDAATNATEGNLHS